MWWFILGVYIGGVVGVILTLQAEEMYGWKELFRYGLTWPLFVILNIIAKTIGD